MLNQTYHLITIGCQMNKADSERLAAFLENNNWQGISDINQARLIIINTCGIRQSAEDRVYGLINQIKKKNKIAKMVVTGCLSRRLDVQKRLNGKVDLFLPASAIPDLFKLLDKKIKQSPLSLDEVRLLQGEKYLSILPKYQNSFSAFVPIGNGCNNFCSYCVVPYARGREVYRLASEVIQEIKGLVRLGYKEIILIAQNVNSYHSKSYNFARLLKSIAEIEGDFWIRFSSSHPKDVSPDLLKIIARYSKICPHLHLAVQSGDDKILKAMNRGYTAEKFFDLISRARELRPELAITTDAIVGFPGETNKQFNNTVKLFKKAKFDLAYIARYSPRPYTAAYKMIDDVALIEKKRREKLLNSVLEKTAIAKNKKYLKKAVRILIEGINKKGLYYGKTGSYKNVIVDGKYQASKVAIGSFIAVKIHKADAFGLTGKLL